MARSLQNDWTRDGRKRTAGASVRAMLLVAATGGGVALAIAVLPLITGWHVGHG
jgi:hypothetical protein